MRPRVVVIPNGVDLDRFRPPTPEERRRAHATRCSSATRSASPSSSATSSTRKGLSFAIEALRYAPTVLLLVVGGTDDIIAEADAAAQELGVGDRVLFLGPRHDLPLFLAASDMFVLPSAYEANALVVLEALASGLPVVTTPVGFAPEIIVDGENGFLVDRDAREIGERLAQLADEDDLVAWSRRARGQRRAVRRGAAIAERYLELADELVAERASASGVERIRAGAPAPEPADDAHRADRARRSSPGSGVAGVAFDARARVRRGGRARSSGSRPSRRADAAAARRRSALGGAPRHAPGT